MMPAQCRTEAYWRRPLRLRPIALRLLPLRDVRPIERDIEDRRLDVERFNVGLLRLLDR
jgi:hypothetical protein